MKKIFIFIGAISIYTFDLICVSDHAAKRQKVSTYTPIIEKLLAVGEQKKHLITLPGDIQDTILKFAVNTPGDIAALALTCKTLSKRISTQKGLRSFLETMLAYNKPLALHLAINAPTLMPLTSILQKLASQDLELRYQGLTPLHQAVLTNKLGAVKLLKHKGSDTKALTNIQETALQLAIQKGHFDIVRYLIQNDALFVFSALTLSTQIDSLIHLAARSGNKELCEYIINAISESLIIPWPLSPFLNQVNSAGNTALHVAADKGHTEIVSLLLDWGFNPAIVNTAGLLPSDLAILNNHQATFEKLLSLIPIATLQQYLNRALALCVIRDCSEPLNFLLSRGADPNSCISEHDGHTPLIHTLIERNNNKSLEILINHGADVTLQDSKSLSPLHKAAMQNKQSVVKLLIESGAAATSKDSKKWTPLHYAALSDNSAMVKLLLEKGASISAKNTFGHTPLLSAISQALSSSKLINTAEHSYLDIHSRQGDISQEIIKYLLNFKSCITEKDTIGWTALHYAANYGDRDLIKTILAHKPDINASNNNGDTPLHIAVSEEDYDVVTELITQGADINYKNKNGETPLHQLVATPCDSALVNYLIQADADVNTRNIYAETPLHAAARCQDSSPVIELLIKAGADINAKDKYGKTPLLCALEHDDYGVIFPIVELLIKHGADVNSADHDGITPLIAALCQDVPEMVSYLVSQKADIYAVDNNGETVLSYVSNCYNVLEALQPILARLPKNSHVISAFVNRANSEGITALHKLACNAHSPEAIELLVAQGADINKRNNKQETPLHMFASSNEALEILESAQISSTAKKIRTLVLSTLRALLKSGADISLKDNSGQTPADLIKLKLTTCNEPELKKIHQAILELLINQENS